MAKADSVLSTPPTNTSALDQPMMFPPTRSASAGHIEAVRVEFAFEEAHDIEGERREEYDRLYAATGDAWDAMDEAARNLVTTKPATLAGILALCRYIGPLFEGDDAPNLPEHINTTTTPRRRRPKHSAILSVQRLRN